jgi:hypothetical protein
VAGCPFGDLAWITSGCSVVMPRLARK